MESLAKNTFALLWGKENTKPFPLSLSPFPDFCKKSKVFGRWQVLLMAIAQRSEQLHRNFQGYITKPQSDLFSMLHNVYVQNHKSLKNYFRAIDSGELPIERGVILDSDDIIRRTVIMELMCQFQLSPDKIQEKYHLSFDCDFAKYFSQE
ncbi:MAG: hypothetical protein RM338_24395 [Nostoc sp. DedQUE12a]|nr:hypothetical protein [Nostoc sp. DedQUE12a]